MIVCTTNNNRYVGGPSTDTDGVTQSLVILSKGRTLCRNETVKQITGAGDSSICTANLIWYGSMCCLCQRSFKHCHRVKVQYRPATIVGKP